MFSWPEAMGFVVAAGPQDRVVLRGLDINGVGGQGLSGIRFLSGAGLMVERCIICTPLASSTT